MRKVTLLTTRETSTSGDRTQSEIIYRFDDDPDKGLAVIISSLGGARSTAVIYTISSVEDGKVFLDAVAGVYSGFPERDDFLTEALKRAGAEVSDEGPW